MRITDQQRQKIRQTLARHFGEDFHVWLFGSRTDDARRGGDVDLYLETKRPTGKDPVLTRIVASAELEQAFDGGKVDLLVRCHGEPLGPLQRMARHEGLPL